jgi:hypothetical protein
LAEVMLEVAGQAAVSVMMSPAQRGRATEVGIFSEIDAAARKYQGRLDRPEDRVAAGQDGGQQNAWMQ